MFHLLNDFGVTFSKPIPVNQPGSAMALGNIRGAQMAVGRGNRIHIAWNGTEPTGHIPMLYARLNNKGDVLTEIRKAEIGLTVRYPLAVAG